MKKLKEKYSKKKYTLTSVICAGVISNRLGGVGGVNWSQTEERVGWCASGLRFKIRSCRQSHSLDVTIRTDSIQLTAVRLTGPKPRYKSSLGGSLASIAVQRAQCSNRTVVGLGHV